MNAKEVREMPAPNGLIRLQIETCAAVLELKEVIQEFLKELISQRSKVAREHKVEPEEKKVERVPLK